MRFPDSVSRAEPSVLASSPIKSRGHVMVADGSQLSGCLGACAQRVNALRFQFGFIRSLRGRAWVSWVRRRGPGWCAGRIRYQPSDGLSLASPLPGDLAGKP